MSDDPNPITEDIAHIRELAERLDDSDNTALQEALDRIVGEPHHVLHVGLQGWSIQHPLTCRPYPMFNCPVHKKISALMGEIDGPADLGGLGEYPVEDVDEFVKEVRER